MKYFVRYLLIGLLTIIFFACEKNDGQQEYNGVTGDIYPIVMRVEVRNAEGEDLLNPNAEFGLNIEDITLEYDGQIYKVEDRTPIDDYVASSTTRYLESHFDGISLRHIDEAYCLVIGYWKSDEKRAYSTMSLNWGDGTSDVLGFTSDYLYNPEYKNSAEHSWGYTFKCTGFLNGKVVDLNQNDSLLEFVIMK